MDKHLERKLVKAEPSYHHGDLRNALINKATEIIEKDGLSAVSLRKIGAQLGVSQAAMYSHFSNKLSMLAAVAEAGYEDLISRLLSANQRSDVHMERIQFQGEAYISFAKQHPHLYQLMFGQLFMDRTSHPELQACKRRSFNILQQVFSDAIASEENSEKDPYIAAVGGRVLVHGLASMIIDGTLSPGKKLAPQDEDVLVSRLLKYFGGII